jgi:hypothetical protein
MQMQQKRPRQGAPNIPSAKAAAKVRCSFSDKNLQLRSAIGNHGVAGVEARAMRAIQ